MTHLSHKPGSRRSILRRITAVFGLLLLAGGHGLQAIEDGDRRGLLGVLLDGQYSGNSEQGLPEGVRIAEIQPGLAADRAQLNEGDIVMAVNGKNVRSVRALQIEISSKKPGSEVVITVYRDNQIFQRPVILGDWFDFLVRTPIFGPFLTDVRLVRLSPEIKQRLDLPADLQGAVVAEITDRSLYQYVLQPGSVVTQINGVPIEEIRSFDALPESDQLDITFVDKGVQGSFSLIKELGAQ